MAAEPFRIGAGQRDLADRRRRLALLELQHAAGQAEHAAPERDRAGGDDQHVAPARGERARHRRQAPRAIPRAACRLAVDQQRRADLDDDPAEDFRPQASICGVEQASAARAIVAHGCQLSAWTPGCRSDRPSDPRR